MNGDEYFLTPSPRAGIVDALKSQLRHDRFDGQVLMSFIGDCFCETSDRSEAAIECLGVLADTGTPTAILSKGGRRTLLASDAVKRFGTGLVTVGATLTMSDPDLSAAWEPGAASPDERISVLREFRQSGIPTFASFEPVIDPAQSLEMIRRSLDAVDVYKVGKLNNHPLECEIDWRKFLSDAVRILRDNGKEFYVKADLRKFADGIGLTVDESDPDAHCLWTDTKQL